MSAFNWLHLTDLHWGQTGQKHLWPEIREQFFDDLKDLRGKCGPWQAVLFSGDFVQQGEVEEFEQLEQDVLGPRVFHGVISVAHWRSPRVHTDP